MYFAGLKGVDLPQKQNEIICDSDTLFRYNLLYKYSKFLYESLSLFTISVR